MLIPMENAFLINLLKMISEHMKTLGRLRLVKEMIMQPVFGTSGISTKMKINLFKACVESILLYDSETWTLSKQLEKRLDGTYTRLLMRVQNIKYKQHFTLEQIYGNLKGLIRR